MSERFLLALFSTSVPLVRTAAAAGIDAFVVDWERRGKRERQEGADTEIGVDGPEDLARVRAATRARVLCRVNRFGETTEAEIDLACRLGADEVLLPMVDGPEEVGAAIELARGRCGVGILVETPAAAAGVKALARLPISRVFVGLNDLGIARGTRNIFAPIVDGLLDEIRAPFRVPFGFGGLTLPDRGTPIPCRLLMGEMARLGCSFAFLRRSFRRDVAGRDLAVELPRLRAALEAAWRRDRATAAAERADLEARVRSWPGSLFAPETAAGG